MRRPPKSPGRRRSRDRHTGLVLAGTAAVPLRAHALEKRDIVDEKLTDRRLVSQHLAAPPDGLPRLCRIEQACIQIGALRDDVGAIQLFKQAVGLVCGAGPDTPIPVTAMDHHRRHQPPEPEAQLLRKRAPQVATVDPARVDPYNDPVAPVPGFNHLEFASGHRHPILLHEGTRCNISGHAPRGPDWVIRRPATRPVHRHRSPRRAAPRVAGPSRARPRPQRGRS